MRSHKLLSHTADARAEVAGESLAELFRAGLEALAELQAGPPASDAAPAPIRERVALEAADATALLVDFLSEALLLSHDRSAVFVAAEFDALDERSLAGEIRGRAVERFARDVKAVTYHEAEVRRDDGGYRTRLVFDL